MLVRPLGDRPTAVVGSFLPTPYLYSNYPTNRTGPPSKLMRNKIYQMARRYANEDQDAGGLLFFEDQLKLYIGKGQGKGRLF